MKKGPFTFSKIIEADSNPKWFVYIKKNPRSFALNLFCKLRRLPIQQNKLAEMKILYAKMQADGSVTQYYKQ